MPSSVTGGGGAYEIPAKATCVNDRKYVSEAPSGQIRDGLTTDVKPGFHWLLKKRPDGALELVEVKAWVEFATPRGPHVTRVQRNGDEEFKKAATVRKEETERWDAMVARRNGRQPARVTRGQLQAEIVRPRVPKGDEPDATASSKVRYPEEERINDETGVKKYTAKIKKAQRKEAKALTQAEDEAVPDTADQLLALKTERGEDGWDFEDDERYSDDEQEKFDFDDQIKPTGANEEDAPSADEEEGEEGEKPDMLTTHGKQIEILLNQFEEGPTLMEVDGAENEDGGDEPAEVESPDRGTADAERPVLARVPSSDSDSMAKRAPRGELAQPPAPKRRRKHELATAAPTKPTAAAAQNGTTARVLGGAEAKKTSPVPIVVDVDEAAAPHPTARATSKDKLPTPRVKASLRDQLVQCLRDRGGRCGLSQAVGALGLRMGDQQSPMWQEAVTAIKEVATTQRVPGESRPVLVLLPAFQ